MIEKESMNFDQLLDKIYSNEIREDPTRFIKLYEENRILIENQKMTLDTDSYNTIMKLTADYAHCLKIKESYSKALPVLEKAIDLFENCDSIDKKRANFRSLKHYQLQKEFEIDFPLKNL